MEIFRFLKMVIFKFILTLFFFSTSLFVFYVSFANNLSEFPPYEFEASLLKKGPSKGCCVVELIKISKIGGVTELIQIIFKIEKGKIVPIFTGKLDLTREEFLTFWKKLGEIGISLFENVYSEEDIFKGMEIRPGFFHAGPAVITIRFFNSIKQEQVNFKLDVELYDDSLKLQTAVYDPLIDLILFEMVVIPGREIPEQDLENFEQLKKEIFEMIKGTFAEKKFVIR